LSQERKTAVDRCPQEVKKKGEAGKQGNASASQHYAAVGSCTFGRDASKGVPIGTTMSPESIPQKGRKTYEEKESVINKRGGEPSTTTKGGR